MEEPITAYESLAIPDTSAFSFGRAPHPVECGFGLIVGGGKVYPELNFTLPPMAITAATWHEVMAEYTEISGIFSRASSRLRLPGLMVEFELLPPMTEHPEWGAEIVALLHDALRRAHEETGLPCALRVTPTDIRDMERPPLLRKGHAWEALLASL
ncbi:MAG TPA: methyltransferase MtaB domain-containing protein, partial [Bacteroidota bacterium]|nr:methyltransferase MtaB domain-containing protein [Bacteroidota bacterium]